MSLLVLLAASAIRSSQSPHVFVSYNGTVTSVELRRYDTASDVIGEAFPDLLRAFDATFDGDLLTEDGLLSDARIGADSVIEVKRNELKPLFRIFTSVHDCQLFLGFPNYVPFCNKETYASHLELHDVTFNADGSVRCLRWISKKLSRPVNWLAFKSLASLRMLTFSRCRLRGHFDVSFMPKSLEGLWLSSNRISSVNLQNLKHSVPRLQSLSLDSNCIWQSLNIKSVCTA